MAYFFSDLVCKHNIFVIFGYKRYASITFSTTDHFFQNQSKYGRYSNKNPD